MSFAAYHLWLHWRQPALYLARQFVDFEPGIHFSQCQMQSGTTGINTLRIYSPTQQAQVQDPDGVFIRRWLPELAQVSAGFVHQPWLMPASLQQRSACSIGGDGAHAYPAPVVDHATARRAARERFAAVRNTLPAKQEADAIAQRHGSRKSGMRMTGQAGRGTARGNRPASPTPPPSPQLSLFDPPDDAG